MKLDLPLAHGKRLQADGCVVMGILNATPDSFSDGGQLTDPSALLAAIRNMRDAGADIFDIGGESTRPGHAPVPADEEIRRVLPVISAVRGEVPDAIISIDTSKGAVAAAALHAGAHMLNDVHGLEDAEMAQLAAETGCAVVAMRHEDCDGDIVQAARQQLQFIRRRALEAGVRPEALILDPGLGFGARPGATVEDNLALVDCIQDYALGHPVLIGASRKRFVGTWAGVADVASRADASAAVAVRAAHAGAAIVRVHDVPQTVQALRSPGV